MGTPIPWPIDGIDCPVCFGVGAPLFPFQTPHYMQADVTGMTRGISWIPGMPEPPNGLYQLTQGLPCSWGWTGNMKQVGVVLGGVQSTFNISMYGMDQVFFGLAGACATSFSNNNPAFPEFWTGGSCSITWLGGP